eukprot:1151364-Pelagomonas_calceolata.AAC.8
MNAIDKICGQLLQPSIAHALLAGQRVPDEGATCSGLLQPEAREDQIGLQMTCCEHKMTAKLRRCI